MPAVKVSVLLTTYNRPVMLREAVESVLTQTFTGYELIILDDNSSDPAQWDVLTEYRQHPKVRLYKDSVQAAERPLRVRYAVLANIGLSLACGEYVTYLCDDDLYYPGRLAAMTERLDRGDCQVVYGSQSVTRGGQQIIVRPATMILDTPACVVDHSSVMHTAQAGRDAGGWDDSPQHWNQADARFWERLVAAGHLFYPVQELTDEHRFHPGSVSEAGIPALRRQPMAWHLAAHGNADGKAEAELYEALAVLLSRPEYGTTSTQFSSPDCNGPLPEPKPKK